MSLRDRTRSLLESHSFNFALATLIVLNVAAVIASSFDDLYRAYQPWFDGFEAGSVVVFTLEYLVRLWVAQRRWQHARSFFSIIDLLAILPFYLPLLVPVDLRVLRVLRVVRLVRVLKLGRFLESFDLVRRVLLREKEALFASLFLLVTLLVVAACLMFAAEREAQPEQFPNILAAMWWAIVTLTTVGYGDVYPVTVLGKVLSGLISVLGIGMVALPAGIISSGFITEFHRARSTPSRPQNEPGCVFCRAPHRPEHEAIVYEDDHAAAVLSLGQKEGNHGAVLVFPKGHSVDIEAIPEADLRHLITVVQKLTRAVKAALQADGITLIQNNGAAGGQDVFHLHWHVVPRYHGDQWTTQPTVNLNLASRALLGQRIRHALAHPQEAAE